MLFIPLGPRAAHVYSSSFYIDHTALVTFLLHLTDIHALHVIPFPHPFSLSSDTKALLCLAWSAGPALLRRASPPLRRTSSRRTHAQDSLASPPPSLPPGRLLSGELVVAVGARQPSHLGQQNRSRLVVALAGKYHETNRSLLAVSLVDFLSISLF